MPVLKPARRRDRQQARTVARLGRVVGDHLAGQVEGEIVVAHRRIYSRIANGAGNGDESRCDLRR